MGGVVDGLLQQRFRSFCRLSSVGVPSGYDSTVPRRGASRNQMAGDFLANQIFG